MNIQEKIEIVTDRINQIDMHITLMKSNIDGGYSKKEGQPSFESLLEDFISKKQALKNELLTLTN